MAKYVIDPDTQGPQSAQVDDVALELGSEPVELSDDQLERLETAGVEVIQADEAKPSTQPTTTDDGEE